MMILVHSQVTWGLWLLAFLLLVVTPAYVKSLGGVSGLETLGSTAPSADPVWLQGQTNSLRRLATLVSNRTIAAPECVKNPDTRQTINYNVAPYSWTVYINMHLGSSSSSGSAFILREMAPPGWILMVTAAHNFYIGSNPITSIDIFVTSQQTFETGIQQGVGCYWYASSKYQQTRVSTEGDDWGIILCDKNKLPSKLFPSSSSAGFAYLMDDTAEQSLINGLPGASAGYPSDKPLPPSLGPKVWYDATNQIMLEDNNLVDMGTMSTTEGSSGSPVWTTELPGYEGQYVAVAVNAYEEGTTPPCWNKASYLTSLVGIEINWLVWTTVPSYQSFTQLRNYLATNVVLAADWQQQPSTVWYAQYDPNNNPSPKQVWLPAKLSMPYSGNNNPPGYVLVNTNNLNPGGGVVQCLTSDTSATATPCLAGGAYNDGCGAMTMTAGIPCVNAASLIWITVSQWGGGFEFGVQAPQVWARINTASPYPNLQTGQGPNESWILDSGVVLY